MDRIDHTIKLGATEKWTVTNNRIFGHSFHIHDVQFKIVARNGSGTSTRSGRSFARPASAESKTRAIATLRNDDAA